MSVIRIAGGSGEAAQRRTAGLQEVPGGTLRSTRGYFTKYPGVLYEVLGGTLRSTRGYFTKYSGVVHEVLGGTSRSTRGILHEVPGGTSRSTLGYFTKYSGVLYEVLGGSSRSARGDLRSTVAKPLQSPNHRQLPASAQSAWFRADRPPSSARHWAEGYRLVRGALNY